MKKNWLVISLFLIIVFTRLLVFNKDASQFFADEGRYPILITNLNEGFKSGNYLLPIRRFFNIDARPGAGLFYLPAAFLEWKNPNTPFGLYFNLMINVLSLIIVFFLIKKIQNKNAALVTTLLVTFSIASFIYIRHTLPYDIAIFLLLLGLYLYVYFKKTFVFGLLAGLSFLTYPSYYYYLIPIPLMLILYQRSIKPALFFIFGLILVFILAQSISLGISDQPYFRSLQDQSEGVTAIHQGDYIPAAAYISEYILAIDGYWNLLLILVIFPGLFLIKDKKKIMFFALYLIFIFLIFELFSHILQKYVLYGRTVRPLYLLALVLVALILERVLRNIKNNRLYFIGLSLLILITFINWLPRFLIYKNLLYPKQFQQKARDYLNSEYEKFEIEDALLVNYWDTDNPDPKLIEHFFKSGQQDKFYTMNAVQTFPYYGNLNLERFCKAQILLKELHIQYTFRPYLFEGYNEIMRKRMEKDPLYYQLIYCRP